jgi:hypothetical protein
MNFDRSHLSPLLPVIAGLLTACSSSPGHPVNGATGQTPDAGSAAAWPDAGEPVGAGGPGAMACSLNTSAAAQSVHAMDSSKGLVSGSYPGDERCILPPDPAAGMQFHYGPTTYDDPAEVAKFELEPGQEITDCVLFPTANPATVYWREYHSRMRPGSHHMLLYLTPLQAGEMPQTAGPVDCNQMATRSAAQQRNLFGAQTAITDVTSLTNGSPENAGLAIQLGPQQQVVMQAHFINATATPILREVWANIMFVDKSQVTELGDPIFFIAGYTMNVMMGQTQVLTGTATVPTAAASDFRLILATGHYHAHTSRFTAYKTVGGQKDLLFEEYGVSDFSKPYSEIPPEPKNWNFISTANNPINDPAAHTSGVGPNSNGTLYMKPGDTIDWECEVHNNDVSSSSPVPYNAPAIKFANAVYSGEMCNMFGLYAPSLAPDTGCSWKGGQVTLISSGNSCP